MSEVKKIKLKLPEGMVLPEGYELPEIEVESASLRRTVVQDDGKMIEIDEQIEIPVIREEK